ncbi:MAG: hypothetical protein AAF211_30025 [Myxococcota bacterium]
MKLLAPVLFVMAACAETPMATVEPPESTLPTEELDPTNPPVVDPPTEEPPPVGLLLLPDRLELIPEEDGTFAACEGDDVVDVFYELEFRLTGQQIEWTVYDAILERFGDSPVRLTEGSPVHCLQADPIAFALNPDATEELQVRGDAVEASDSGLRPFDPFPGDAFTWQFAYDGTANLGERYFTRWVGEPGSRCGLRLHVSIRGGDTPIEDMRAAHCL